MELSPLAAAGIFYASAAYAKGRGRRMRGGEDVVSTTPGGAVPVISAGKLEAPKQVVAAVGGKEAPANTQMSAGFRHESPAVAGSAMGSPLVAGSLNLTGNPYLGATSGSRAAPLDAPGGLLQSGGAKKRRGRKQKGGEVPYLPASLEPQSTSPQPLPPVPSMGGTCHPMNTPIPPGTLSGGSLGLSAVVPGAVGGVAAQSTPGELMGGGKRRGRKSKKHGGMDNNVAPPAAPVRPRGPPRNRPHAGDVAIRQRALMAAMADAAADADAAREEQTLAPGTPRGGAKSKSRKGKKRGGAEEDAPGGAPQEAPVGGTVTAEGVVAGYMGGAKSKRKGKKRGGDCGYMSGGEDYEMEMEGGAKRRGRKGKKRGGAEGDVEPFNADNSDLAPAMGGFDSLLADLKKQVGGGKKKGGAFKLYAKELAALSKKLKKLA